MDIMVQWNGNKYSIDPQKPLCLAITLRNGLENQPNAYGAPLFESSPVKSGDFTGSLDAGSPVNFMNLRLNPHGNGTHTESIGHIHGGDYSINKCLQDVFAVAEVVSIYPELLKNGDRVITPDSLKNFCAYKTEALIIRTLPNEPDKKIRKYTGTNPPYMTAQSAQWLVERGVKHLLLDLPSVDREEDGGALEAHKMFWGLPKKPEVSRTITEMIYVDNNVVDGLYLLNLQVAPLGIDASPSRPMIFRLTQIE